MVTQSSKFQSVMAPIRRQFPTLILFSFLVNLLLLVSAIYMLQVYDRANGHEDDTRVLEVPLALDQRIERPSVRVSNANRRPVRLCQLDELANAFDDDIGALRVVIQEDPVPRGGHAEFPRHIIGD